MQKQQDKQDVEQGIQTLTSDKGLNTLINDAKPDKKNIYSEKKLLIELLGKVRDVRLKELQTLNESSTVGSLSDSIDFTNAQKLALRLKQHLNDLDSDLDEIEELDGDGKMWAKKTKESTETLSAVLVTVGAFGAGITYTTIFSAMRGSIALMSWSFTLFCTTFLTSAFVQGFLAWVLNTPRDAKIPSPKLSQFIVGTLLQLSTLLATIGFILLLLTIHLLAASPDPTGNSTDLGHTNAPRWASLTAITVIGIGALLSFVPDAMLIHRNGIGIWWSTYFSVPKERTTYVWF